MNRAAECVCPSLCSEAPLRLSLPWECIDFEFQGISTCTECFRINISDFEFCNGHKIVLKKYFLINLCVRTRSGSQWSFSVRAVDNYYFSLEARLNSLTLKWHTVSTEIQLSWAGDEGGQLWVKTVSALRTWTSCARGSEPEGREAPY